MATGWSILWKQGLHKTISDPAQTGGIDTALSIHLVCKVPSFTLLTFVERGGCDSGKALQLS